MIGRTVFTGLVLLLGAVSLGIADVQPELPQKGGIASGGKIVELDSSITAETLARVSRIVQKMSADRKENRQEGIPTLVLKIMDGQSRFGDVRELAKYISEHTSEVRFVAWIPRDLRGMNVIPALACQEIVMSPRASMGDIGRGAAIDPDVRSFVVSLIESRRNPLLNEALITGMLDRQQEVVWVRVKSGEPPAQTTESRVLLAPDFEKLVQAKAVIEERRILKAGGEEGMYLGSRLRDLNLLATHLLEDEQAVLDQYHLSRETLLEQNSDGKAPRVAMLRVHGVIDGLQEEYIHRQMERQIHSGVNLLIFEVDSPGGYLEPCTRLANFIADCELRKVRTVAFVPERAISGGAIVAFGCDAVFLRPNALIGDAGPIELRRDQAFHRVPEKILSPLVQHLRIIAERKRRPPSLLAAMADKSLEVFQVTNKKTGKITYMSDEDLRIDGDQWQKGALVPESKEGLLLTLTGRRAHELQLAEAPVENLAELQQRLGIPAKTKLVPLAPKFVDRLVFVLNSDFATGLLIVLGIVFLYIEIHVPTGICAIGAVTCFALFFWSRFLGGTADWLEVVLFLLGVGCLALEAFVIPGFGVFGLTGGLLVLISVVLAGQTFYLPNSLEDYQQVGRSITTLGVSVGVLLALAVMLGRMLPRSKLWDKLVLVPPGGAYPRDPNEPRLDPHWLERGSSQGNLIGARGETTSSLRPAGRVLVGDQMLNVVSEGGFIEQGQQVEIVSIVGNRIVVRAV
ncbi:MAG: NfeD family protein [Planctomycetales bacterium]